MTPDGSGGSGGRGEGGAGGQTWVPSWTTYPTYHVAAPVAADPPRWDVPPCPYNRLALYVMEMARQQKERDAESS